MTMKFVRASVFAAVVAVAIFSTPSVQAFQPENPLCIAPSNPGGGWDFICRTTAKNLFELGVIKDAMQVTNMSGGGGGVAAGSGDPMPGEPVMVFCIAAPLRPPCGN